MISPMRNGGITDKGLVNRYGNWREVLFMIAF